MTVAKLRLKRRLVEIYIWNCWTLKPFTVSRILLWRNGAAWDRQHPQSKFWASSDKKAVRTICDSYSEPQESEPWCTHAQLPIHFPATHSSRHTESPGSSDLRNSSNVWDKHQIKQKEPRGRKDRETRKKVNPVTNNLRQIISVAWQMLMEGFALSQALF